MANQVGPEDDTFRVVVCGRRGHGKTTVCNALLGSESFPAGTPTATAALGQTKRNGIKIKVVDTPDISTDEMKKKEKEEEVARWKEFVSPEATCLLLVIKSDVPFTEEDFIAYRQIRRFWGKGSAREKLVVVFTFSEGQDVEEVGERMESESPKWMGKILADSGGRYIVFKGKGAGNLLDDVLDDCKGDDSDGEKEEKEEGNRGKGHGRGRDGTGKGKGRGKGRGQRQGHGLGLGRENKGQRRGSGGGGEGGGGGLGGMCGGGMCGGGNNKFVCCLLQMCCRPKH